jgi:hypothetical protein
MTGGEADVNDSMSSKFSAWDGYISGTNRELNRPSLIVQDWRTVEFDDTDPDSRLEVHLEPTEGGTLITIRHSNLPDHGMQYKQGWIDNYFNPMKEYF